MLYSESTDLIVNLIKKIPSASSNIQATYLDNVCLTTYLGSCGLAKETHIINHQKCIFLSIYIPRMMLSSVVNTKCLSDNEMGLGSE